jgi:ssDNA-binding Zn-finger/Zn-ribbon topoisomerase 1
MKHPIFKRVEELGDKIHFQWSIYDPIDDENLDLKIFVTCSENPGHTEANPYIFDGLIHARDKQYLFDLILEKIDEIYPPIEDVKPSRQEMKCPKCGAGEKDIGWVPSPGHAGKFVISYCGKCNFYSDPCKELNDAYKAFREPEVRECCPWCGPGCKTDHESIERFIRGTK